MAVTVTGPLATPVISAVTLVAGGSLVANTTYYFRVVAQDQTHINTSQLTSAPSAEGTFTTNTTNKSVKIDWSAITGATQYMVYYTTVSGSYNNKSLGNINTYNGYTTAATTYTITGAEAFTGNQHAWANFNEAFESTPVVTSTGLIKSFQNKAQYTHALLDLASITPSATQGGISSYVIFKVERKTCSTEPLNPATSLFLLGADIHYQQDTMGSRGITSK